MKHPYIYNLLIKKLNALYASHAITTDIHTYMQTRKRTYRLSIITVIHARLDLRARFIMVMLMHVIIVVYVVSRDMIKSVRTGNEIHSNQLPSRFETDYSIYGMIRCVKNRLTW